MAISLSVSVTDDMADALATLIGSAALVEIHTGPKPATPESAATGILLATVTLTGSFAGSGGSIISSDPAQVTPVASGTAGYFRIKTSGGTAVLDGTVTLVGAGGDMQLTSTALTTGTPVDLGVLTFVMPVA